MSAQVGTQRPIGLICGYYPYNLPSHISGVGRGLYCRGGRHSVKPDPSSIVPKFPWSRSQRGHRSTAHVCHKLLNGARIPNRRGSYQRASVEVFLASVACPSVSSERQRTLPSFFSEEQSLVLFPVQVP